MLVSFMAGCKSDDDDAKDDPMNIIDIQLDFDNMTYSQSYMDQGNTVSDSFEYINIGNTTISASQMTAQ